MIIKMNLVHKYFFGKETRNVQSSTSSMYHPSNFHSTPTTEGVESTRRNSVCIFGVQEVLVDLKM